MKEVWHKLIEFETRDLVERAIKRRHERSPSARAINEITSNFIQAREYYLNAERSAITVRPLLLYYGVLALNRGLILTLDIKLSESALKPAHGLAIKEWRETLKNELKNIGLLKVCITEGTFYDLLRVTGNKSYFKANSSGVNWEASFSLPEIRTCLTFEDIVKSIPDLSEEYQVWKNEEFVSKKVEEFTRQEPDHYVMKLNQPEKAEHLEMIFPGVDYERLDEDTTKLTVKFPVSFVPYFTQKIPKGASSIFGIGDVYLVPPIQKDVYLNMLSLYFSASYVLGMMVRYFPSVWISLGRVEKGDSVFPLINRLMSIIQNDYPQLVLDFLQSPYEFET
jgi:hypothetical protein